MEEAMSANVDGTIGDVRITLVYEGRKSKIFEADLKF